MLHYCTSDRERKKSEIERVENLFSCRERKKHQNKRKKQTHSLTHNKKHLYEDFETKMEGKKVSAEKNIHYVI